MDDDKTPLAPITLRSGIDMPALGFGTWHLGESRGAWQSEAAALLHAVDVGFTQFDTAEMYGDGAAEELLGEVLQQRQRDKLFLTSKVYPWKADGERMVAACEDSLKRLQTDYLDLYLLHWRGQYPFDETVSGFERLKSDGKILHWGVSNLDADDMKELLGVRDGTKCAVNQVLYNLSDRGVEWDLKPGLDEKQIPLMAYCPLGEGRLLRDASLATLADRHRVTPASIALAWLMAQKNTIAIPKTSRAERIKPIVAALDIELDEDDLALLDHEFPPPDGPSALSIV